jgi:NAD-dependent DNA ligase
MHKNLIALSWIGLLAWIAAAYDQPSAAPPPEVFSLSKLKTQAEQWTKQVKARYRPNSTEYRTTRKLYFDARASVNGWIDQVKTEIRANRDLRLSTAAQLQQDEAAKKAQQLVDYLNRLFGRGAFPGGGVILDAVAKVFGDTVSQILTEYFKAEQSKLDGVLSQIEELRWKEFEEI